MYFIYLFWNCSLKCRLSSICLFLTGSMQVFLPPEGLANFGEANPTQDNVFCAQLQRFQIKSMNERGLHSWHAENCYKKFPFLCKRSTSGGVKTDEPCLMALKLKESHSGIFLFFFPMLVLIYNINQFLQQDKLVWISKTTWWMRALTSRLKGTTRVWAARATTASQRCVWPPCVSVHKAASISERTLKSVASSPVWIPVLL